MSWVCPWVPLVSCCPDSQKGYLYARFPRPERHWKKRGALREKSLSQYHMLLSTRNTECECRVCGFQWEPNSFLLIPHTQESLAGERQALANCSPQRGFLLLQTPSQSGCFSYSAWRNFKLVATPGTPGPTMGWASSLSRKTFLQRRLGTTASVWWVTVQETKGKTSRHGCLTQETKLGTIL